MAEFMNLPHLNYDYEKPNEYIDPMKPLIEEFITNWRIQEEDHIMKAVSDVGISVDKPRLIQALTDAKAFYEEGYIAGRNSVCQHGEWEHHSTDDNDMVILRCSVCGRKQYGNSNYCPNCGAKMDGKGDGE